MKTEDKKKVSKRISWSDIDNVDCINLVNYGLHAHTISKATGLSRSQIYYRARQVGVRLRDYRDGRGPVANILVKRFTVKDISTEDKGQLSLLVPMIERKLQKKKK